MLAIAVLDGQYCVLPSNALVGTFSVSLEVHHEPTSVWLFGDFGLFLWEVGEIRIRKWKKIHIYIFPSVPPNHSTKGDANSSINISQFTKYFVYSSSTSILKKYCKWNDENRTYIGWVMSTPNSLTMVFGGSTPQEINCNTTNTWNTNPILDNIIS